MAPFKKDLDAPNDLEKADPP